MQPIPDVRQLNVRTRPIGFSLLVFVFVLLSVGAIGHAAILILGGTSLYSGVAALLAVAYAVAACFTARALSTVASWSLAALRIWILTVALLIGWDLIAPGARSGPPLLRDPLGILVIAAVLLILHCYVARTLRAAGQQAYLDSPGQA